MTPLLLCGAGLGVGLFLIARGVRPRPIPIPVLVRRMEHPPASTSGSLSPTAERPGLQRFVRGNVSPGTARDLAVVGRDPVRHATEKLTTALGLGGVAAVFALTISLAAGTVVAAAVTCGGVGFVAPDLLLKSHAKARRNAFRHALSSFLDLVNVMLAGGAGVETSLEAAADAGDGWVFDHLKEALVRARATRRSPWAAFADLADRLGIAELSELSASVQLAGEQGARIRSSLSAKATAMRAHQLAGIEAEAQAASERMGLPTVLMFLGFLLLMAYPAIDQIVGF